MTATSKSGKRTTPAKRSTGPAVARPRVARPGDEPTLTTRELNRALLARQLLLARAQVTPLAAIEQLVALQAQVARPPFLGLWSRVHGFSRDQLHGLLHRREVVRATFLRGTLHLVAARDFLAFRAALQPMLSAAFHAVLKSRGAGLDMAALAAFTRTRLPATFDDLRPQLIGAFRSHDERALGYAVRMHVPLIQVPTADPWAFPASAAFDSAESWLGKSLDPELALPGLVRRYLAAFGPATIQDAQRWSGIANLTAAFEALRPELVTFRDDKRRLLFDLPDAPRPAADTGAPARLIADYDNLVLGHDDRRRVVADEHRARLVTKNLQVKATFLVDGFVAGTWAIERTRQCVTLTLAPFTPLAKPARTAVEAEASAMLRFVEPDAEHRVV